MEYAVWAETSGFNVVLFFSQMGLGKTIQAIAISYYYKNEWPLLIVVPSSLRYPWVDEMEKWIPELSPDDISIIQNKTDIGWVVCSSL